MTAPEEQEWLLLFASQVVQGYLASGRTNLDTMALNIDRRKEMARVSFDVGEAMLEEYRSRYDND